MKRGVTKKPISWHHSFLSSVAGDGSHSTDQPGGRVQGQVRLANMSSKVSPETKWATSKAEYTNTQQGLPDWGYTLALYLEMKGFWLEGLFCRKAVKSRSLIAGYSFQVIVQLTILGEHLSNSIHGENNYLLSSNQSYSSSSSFTSYSMWQKG